MADTSCLFSLFRTDFSQYDHRSTAKLYVFVPSQRACACTHMFIKHEINFYQQYLVRSAYVAHSNHVYSILKTDISSYPCSAMLVKFLPLFLRFFFFPLSPFVSLLSSYLSFRQFTLNTR